MYLLEATGKDAFELMADLFDPIGEIASDKMILKCIQTNQKVKAIKFAMKNHSESLIKVLALCNNIDASEYNKTAPEMLADVMQVINHPTIASLFTSQAQSESEASFGSATENTEATE